MSSVPLANSRVSFQQSSSLLLGTLQSDQANLLQVQQQISTGNRLNLGSDDPAATLGIQSLNRQIADNGEYTSNLNFAQAYLQPADHALSSVFGVINSATTVASQEVGTGATADERAAQASVVDSYIQEALGYANTQYNGQSVFGGANSTGSAFVGSGTGYKYAGSNLTSGILTPTGAQLQYSINGNDVFGGVASEVQGTQTLTPALTATTPLADVTGATGTAITTGPVNLTVGGTTVSVDLSKAATAGDVVNGLNAALTAAGSTATVSLSGSSFFINGDASQAVSISDTQGGNTAAELGIAASVPPTSSLVGNALTPRVTVTTQLSALNAGAGVDPTGLVITNGTSTKTISLTGLHTVGDLLNAINNSGTNVQASINSANNGINIENTLSGTSLTVGENGGTTAADLGVRSFNTSTALSSLNSGEGVTPISTTTGKTPSGQIQITKTDGTTFDVTVTGITTQAQLIAAINTASGNGSVTAAANASDNGITLTDSSGGAGNISVVADPNYVSNGAQLGILPSTGGTMTGTGGTLVGNSIAYSTDDFRITRKDGTSFSVNVTGDATVQDVLNSINGAAGNTNPANQVTAQLNPNGNGIELLDGSTGTGTLSVTSLNNSTAATQLGILKSGSTATPGTINGDDVNPLESTGLFSSLTMLRDALLNNDTAGIQKAADLLAQNLTQVTKVQGVVAAREQDIVNRLSDTADQKTQLQSSLSLLADTDVTSAITQYQTLQTAYEAALKVSQTTSDESLLDFLK